MKSNYLSLSSGGQIPPMLYGTAWKKDKTTEYVVQAVTTGFRGIDTACQLKHYREDLVGVALDKLYKQDIVKREDLYLQTKFTSLSGQDQAQPLPYDPRATIPEQVKQSFKKSLINLKTEYLDGYLLHGPYPSHKDTMLAWRVLEELVEQGKVKNIGICNIYNVKALEQICNEAKIKPHIIQNRFYNITAYDKDLRHKVCKPNNIRYQSFWTLTANEDIVGDRRLVNIAKKKGWTPAQTWFRYLIKKGIVPLSGTTNVDHMKQDLAISMLFNHEKELTAEETVEIGQIYKDM